MAGYLVSQQCNYLTWPLGSSLLLINEKKMKELSAHELESVSAGALPALVGYYMYMGGSISSIFSVLDYVGKKHN
jgi:hypothetical protein